MSEQLVTPELRLWIVAQAQAGHKPEAVLQAMRASGWQGRAILLDGSKSGDALARQALLQGDRIESRSIGDAALLAAVAASLHRDAT